VPFFDGADWSPNNTRWPWRRPIYVVRTSGILIHVAFWPYTRHGRKEGGCNVAWAEIYLRTKWHLDPSRSLAIIPGPKSGGCCAPFLGRAGSPCNTMSPEPRPTAVSKWHLDPSSRLATTDRHGPKIGGCAPFGEGSAAGPHLTQYGLGRGAYSYMPSFILIRSNRLATVHQRHRPKLGPRLGAVPLLGKAAQLVTYF